ncbi:MAG: hypothetical protein P8N67_03400 [Pseudomonadales bacterium]|nr:hypothetical protein [Pseudomonadales bacterium]
MNVSTLKYSIYSAIRGERVMAVICGLWHVVTPVSSQRYFTQENANIATFYDPGNSVG